MSTFRVGADNSIAPGKEQVRLLPSPEERADLYDAPFKKRQRDVIGYLSVNGRAADTGAMDRRGMVNPQRSVHQAEVAGSSPAGPVRLKGQVTRP